MPKLEKYISEVVEQLSFDISSLAEDEDYSKYKTDILKAEDVDHDFVMRLLKQSESSKSRSEVLNVFKISPKDEKDLEKLKRENLFFNGVKSNKVHSILSDGYI